MSQIIGNVVGSSFTKPMSLITDFVKTVAKNAPAIGLVAAVTPDIMDFMKGLTEPFYETGEAMEELGLTASEGFETMATDIANSIYDLEPVAQQLGVWVGDTYDKVQAKDWTGLSENIETGLTSAWDGIVGFFNNETLMTDIGDGVSSLVNGIAGFVDNISSEDIQKISDGFNTMISTAITNISSEDIQKISDGFNTMISTAITNIDWSVVASAVKAALIDIPFAIGYSIGEWIGEAIVNAINWIKDNGSDEPQLGDDDYGAYMAGLQ